MKNKQNLFSLHVTGTCQAFLSSLSALKLELKHMDGSSFLEIYRYTSVYGWSFQKLGSDTQSAKQLVLDLSIYSCWHLDIGAQELQLYSSLHQNTHMHIGGQDSPGPQ